MSLSCRAHIVGYPSEYATTRFELARKIARVVFGGVNADGVLFADDSNPETYNKIYEIAKATYNGYKTIIASGGTIPERRNRPVVIFGDLESTMRFIGSQRISDIVSYGDFAVIVILFKSTTAKSTVDTFAASIPNACIEYLSDLKPITPGVDGETKREAVARAAKPDVSQFVVTTPPSLQQVEQCIQKCAEAGRRDCKCGDLAPNARIVESVLSDKPISAADVAMITGVKAAAQPVAPPDVGPKLGALADILAKQRMARVEATQRLGTGKPGDVFEGDTAAKLESALSDKPQLGIPVSQAPAIAEAAKVGMGPFDRHVIYAANPDLVAAIDVLLTQMRVPHSVALRTETMDIHARVISNLFNGDDRRYGALAPPHVSAFELMRARANAEDAQARYAMRALECAVRKDQEAGLIPAYTGNTPGQAPRDVSTSLELVAREVGNPQNSASLAVQYSAARAAAIDEAKRYAANAPWVLVTDSLPTTRPKYVSHIHVMDGGDEAVDVMSSLYGKDSRYHVPRMSVYQHVSAFPTAEDFVAAGNGDHLDADTAIYTAADGCAGDPPEGVFDPPGVCGLLGEVDEFGIPARAFEYTGYLTVKTKADNAKRVVERVETTAYDSAGQKTVDIQVKTRPYEATEASENTYVRKYDIYTCGGAAARRRAARKRGAVGGGVFWCDERTSPSVVSAFDDVTTFVPYSVSDGPVQIARTTQDPVYRHDLDRVQENIARFDAFFDGTMRLVDASDQITFGEFRKRLEAAVAPPPKL